MDGSLPSAAAVRLLKMNAAGEAIAMDVSVRPGAIRRDFSEADTQRAGRLWKRSHGQSDLLDHTSL